MCCIFKALAHYFFTYLVNMLLCIYICVELESEFSQRMPCIQFLIQYPHLLDGLGTSALSKSENC